MTKSKDLILKLREVQKEKKLSYDKILALMEQDGFYSSKSTLSRLFGENWEKHKFDYEDTLIPIANVLLDVDTIEEDDDADTRLFKTLLRKKMSVIDDNAKQIEELKEQIKDVSNKEKLKYSQKLQAETENFQKSLDFAMNQIELKDQRITQLLDANIQLLNQLLSCPCRKNDKIGEGK